MSKASRGVYYTHLPHIIHCVNLFHLHTHCLPSELFVYPLALDFLNPHTPQYYYLHIPITKNANPGDLCCLDSIMAFKY